MKNIKILSLILLLLPLSAHAIPIVIEDTADRFEITFVNDDFVNDYAPIGAAGGRMLDIFTGGESAAIAISITFEDSLGNNEDIIFIFEGITTDPFFPGPNAPGDVLVYSSFNGFAGADALVGDGLLPAFNSTTLTVTVGPDRDDPFFARLVLENIVVSEPGTLLLLVMGLVAIGLSRRNRG